MTLAALKFHQEIKTNVNLMLKSDVVPFKDVRDAYHQALHSLERGFLIYPPSMSVHLKQGTPLKEKKILLNLDKNPTPETHANVQEFEHHLKEQARENGKNEWMWRVGMHHWQMNLEGWYPFFATLTVDENLTMAPPKWIKKRNPKTNRMRKHNIGGLGMTAEQMWKEGSTWTKYKRDIADFVAEHMGFKTIDESGMLESDFAQFFGVLEHGETGEHHHMHVLMWLRDIPDSWKRCPNYGLRPEFRKRQRCLPLETFWPWAQPLNRPVLYFRNAGDIWSRLGFCVPLSRKTGKALKLHPIIRAGTYFVKYLNKGTREWPHRVKATRNLGLKNLQDVLHRMHINHLEALTWRPRKYSQSVFLSTIHSVPAALLRRQAKLIFFCRQWVNGRVDSDKLLSESSDSYKQMLMSVRAGQRPHRMASGPRYAWVSQHLPVPDGYCEKRIERAHKKLQLIAPVIHPTVIQPLGANRQ